MISKPGKGGKTFILVLGQDCFRKGDIIVSSIGQSKVVKVYKPTLIRRFLNWVGIKVRMKGLKCKKLD